jgi:hormone-sensitive lipase
VIVHFHGGGFISGSSQAHEVYLRQWARLTGAVVFSVDYRLAPALKYPTQVEECLHAYRYVRRHFAGQRRVVLAGDSAGGNLAMAVVIKCLRESVPLPDGIMLAYPSVDLCPAVTPSRLLFINDPVVPFRISKLLCVGYMPEGCDPGRDALLSPLHASDTELACLPPVHIAAAELDPLADEAEYLTLRLQAAGVQVTQHVYDSLPHGFLSMAQWVPEAAQAIEDTALVMQRMLM